MSFAVGDKVVCVDDSGCEGAHPRWYMPCGPVVRDGVYCVESIEVDDWGVPGLVLVGVPIMWVYPGGRLGLVGWKLWRFRKLEEIQAEAWERRAAGLQRGVSKPGRVSEPCEVSGALQGGCLSQVEGGQA